MPQAGGKPQEELRTERASTALTKDEKRRLQALALIRNTDMSNLLREMSVADALEEYGRITGDTGKAA